MKRGEVWWVAFDPSVGSEVRKTRSAVIVSNDVANRFLRRVTVIPLTSNTQRVYPSECLVSVAGTFAKAMIDQMTVADKRRLHKRMGRLSRDEMLRIESVIRLHLGFET